MIRIIAGALTLAAVLYLAACAALFFFQGSLIYHPQPAAVGTPDTRMKLAADGAEVHVSRRPHEGPGALIYFGGNAEDVSASMPALAEAFPDRALYLMHYRGFGDSAGTPSEKALQKDALVLYDTVHAHHSDIVVMGRSLGTGIAVRLAGERPATRLVLVTPYDSLEDIAATQFPYFPVRWLLKEKYDAGRYAPAIRVPTLVMAAESDEVIPRWSTEQIYARFQKGVATLKILPGTGHNTISASPLYLETLRSP